MTVIDQLLQDPSFLTGISLLGGPNAQIGERVQGAQRSIAAQQAAQQMAKLRQFEIEQGNARQAFNPNDYLTQPGQGALGGTVNLQGMLQPAMRAGYSPEQAQGLANIMDPETAARLAISMRPPVSLAPGAQLVSPNGGPPIATNTNAPPDSKLGQLNQLNTFYNQLPPDSPMRPQIKAAIDQVSGVFDQGMRTQQMEATQAQRDVTNEMQRQTHAGVQAQRDMQNQFHIQGQVTKLGTELQKNGIPQAEDNLKAMEELIQKYPTGDIPGFTAKDYALAKISPALLSEEARTNQQRFAPLFNVTLKNRNGARITPPEVERLNVEMGTGMLVPNAANRIRQGAAQLRQTLEAEKKNYAASTPADILNSYEENGGMPLSYLRKQSDTKAGGTAAPKSKADYDALPSGSVFVAPDGTTRRKP